MSARDALRRFLEQRREAGETELVLDGLSVEEALKLIGVSAPAAPDNAAVREQRRPLAPDAGPADTDWRAALRKADSAPAASPGARVPSSSAPAAPPASAQTTVGGGRLGFDVSEGQGAVLDDGRATGVPAPGLAEVPQGLVVGTGGRELFSGPESAFATLDDLVRAVATCRLCPLSRDAKNPVPGEGNPNAGLVCVGEAPGATEDEQGVPFVGQAGQLLTKILAAIQLSREDVYICNVLKHRPPGNRNPLPSEVEACSPYLVRQIELIRPKVIVAFGTFAAQTLLNTKEAIGKLRGKIHRYYGVPLVVTYHPAALLRNPAWKRPTWEDVKLARRLLDRASGDE